AGRAAAAEIVVDAEEGERQRDERQDDLDHSLLPIDEIKHDLDVILWPGTHPAILPTECEWRNVDSSVLRTTVKERTGAGPEPVLAERTPPQAAPALAFRGIADFTTAGAGSYAL